MPQISRFFGVVIYMYFNDHAPPHFHAEYGEFEAVYTIETLEVLRGKLPRRAHSMVLEWAHCTVMNYGRIGFAPSKCNRWNQLSHSIETAGEQKMNLGKRVRVRKATPLEDFEMLVEFEDGSQKEIDLEPFLRGEIFEPIRNNPKMFQDVRIEGGTIAWANGADIDPDVLYYDLKPAWMEETEVV